ncbi:MAG: hypothetical protein OXU78_02390, partial [Deltaproteobacteria bacterium]|nr:hypothetical protein [Deltaproteobacteria bacterium]
IQIGTANRAMLGNSPGRGGSRGFDRTTKDPTAASHPDTPGGGWYPRSDYYQFSIPAGYPGTPRASASPETVNEGQTITLSSSGSTLPSLNPVLLNLLGIAGRPSYSMDWVQVTDMSGATAVSSDDALTITTGDGALIRTGFTGTSPTLRLQHGTVTAPDVIEPTTLHFRLDITSMRAGFTPDRRSVVTSVTVNDTEPPTAMLTVDGEAWDFGTITVDEGTTTELAATATDPDGDTALSYEWTWTSSPALSFDNPASPTQTITWPSDLAARSTRDFSIQLLVTDRQGLQRDILPTVTVRDTTPPTASTSGSPTSVQAGDTEVTLDGSSSRRAGGHTDASGITFNWIQTATASSDTALVSGDTNYVVLTAGAGENLGTATFTAPSVTRPTTLHFLLTVTDQVTTRTATARAAVRVATAALMASAGSDQTVTDFDDDGTATTVTLSGLAAMGAVAAADFDYAWVQVTSENDATVISSGANYAGALTNASTATATFTAPDVPTTAIYYFQLTVNQTGMSAEDDDVVAITVNDNEAPTATISTAAASVNEGTMTTLSASGSDPDGDATLNYAWTVSPDIPSSPFVDATMASTTVTWPTLPAGVASRDYTLTLAVTDSRSLTGTSEVVFTVQNQDGPPTARAGTTAENNRFLPGATVTLQGDGSTNAVGVANTGLTYAWIQTADATSSAALASSHMDYVMLSSATAANPTFTAPSTDATLHFRLTVTDTMFTAGTVNSDTARVAVAVELPAAVIVDRVAGNLTEGGTGFGFRACRRSGGGQNVTGAIRVVATISGTPNAADDDVENGDFATARGGSMTTSSGVLQIGAGADCAEAYNLFYANADRLLEVEEAFRVTLSLEPGADSGGVPVYLAGGVSTTLDRSVADNDSATASIARYDDDGFTEGGSGTVGTAAFRVTVNGAELAAAATITFTVSGGTPPAPGMMGNDYTVTPAAVGGVYTLTVNPMPDGTPDSAEITLTQVNDAEMETPETITVTITGAATIIGTVSIAASPMDAASAVLVDDDGTRMANLSIARATDGDGFTEGASGGAGSTSFTVTLSAALPNSVTAPFSISGASADDYDITAPTGLMPSATGGSITIAAGQTTAAITLTASSDTSLEGDETLTVTLGEDSTYTYGGGPMIMVSLDDTKKSATATITDGSTPTITLTAPMGNLDETPTSDSATNHQGVFTVAITGVDLTAAASIVFSVTGCGTGQSADCTFTPASPLTIPADGDGSQQATITVTARADTLNEPAETITLSLDSGSMGGAALDVSAVADASTAIEDDDPVLATISHTGGTGEVTDDDGNVLGYNEAGSLSFKVTLSGGERATGVLTSLQIWVRGTESRGLQPSEFEITAPSVPTGTLSSGGITITAFSIVIRHDEDSADIELNLLGDERSEGHEPLRLIGRNSGANRLRFGQLGSGPIRYGAIEYAQNGRTVTVDVYDDDDITISLVPAIGTDTDPDTAGIQVREGSTVLLLATLSHTAEGGITFHYLAGIAAQANLEGQADNSGTMGLGTAADADFYPRGERVPNNMVHSSTRAIAGQMDADIRIEIKADRLAEADETLTVTLTSEDFPSRLRGPFGRGNDSVNLIIVANSAAAHSLSLSGPASLDEGDAAQTYTITRNGPAIPDGTALSVIWGFQNGAGENAVAAADFTGGLPAGGTLSFSGSETSKTFTIDPAQDTLAEGGADGEENFTLTLAKDTTDSTETELGGVQVATTSLAVSLGDSSDNLVVAIHNRSASPISEDDGTVTWRISVTGATSTAAVTVPFTIMNTGSNTALTAGDYDITAPGGVAASANSGSITINAGDGGTANMCGTCGSITVTARSDTLLEGPENLTLLLGTPTGGGGLIALSAAVTTPGAEAPAGGAMPATITDTDQLTATLSGGGAVNEGGNAEVTVTLSGATHTADVVVAYTVGADTDDATANAGAEDHDFTAGDSITIAPGTNSGIIRIAVAEDNLNEAGETFAVSVSNSQVTSSGAVAAAASPRTFTITDDDPITYGIAPVSGQSATLSEGGSASFTITLSGGRLPADARVTASVTGAVDSGDYNITAPGGIGEAAQSAAVLLVAQSSPTSGAATASGVFSLSITADQLNEAAETLTVSIAAPEFTGSGVLTAGETSAMLSIRQSDPLTVSVTRSSPVGAGGVDEGQAVVFRVSLSHRSGGAVSVPWTAQMGTQMHRQGQGANSASQPDLTASGVTPSVANGLTALSGTLQIAAGSMDGMVSITANSDGVDELEESFTFTISAPMGGAQSGAVALGSPAQATASINPAAHIVRVQGPNAAVAEGAHAEFTLRLPASTTSPRSTPLTVAYALSGGQSGVDYAAADASGSVTFSASETSKPVRIAILSDGLNEGEETITLALGEVTNANTFPGGAIALGSASATIAASNPATYSMGNGRAAEPAANAAGSLRIPVTLSARSAGEVTIPFSIGSGTAVAGSDYTTPAALQVTIPAGQMTGNIEIALLADPVHEADETILITLGATPVIGSGGGAVSLSTAAGANTGTGTISGNDPLEVDIRLANAAQTSVSEGAPVALRLGLAAGGAAAASQGDVLITFTTQVVQQNAAAGAAANTGGDGADIALPENNCGDTPAAVTVAADGSATGCIRIPAGETSQQFSIQTLYDGLDENGADDSTPAETVTLSLTSFASSLGASAAAIGLTPATERQTGSFTINNIDSRRQLSLRASATALQEEAGAQLSFSLAMTGAEVASSFEVAWEITGASTAVAEDTTGARSGTLAIPAGYSASSAALEITTLGIVDDALNEGPETLILRLSEAPGHPLMTAGGRPGTFGGPATTFTTASVTATIGASDPVAVSLARRAGETGRLVSGQAANYVARLGATASTNLSLGIAATLGGNALTLPPVTAAAGESEAAVLLPANLIDAATAAASGEVQLAVSISGVTGAPPGATAAPHAADAAAENIAVTGWELSLAPTGSATQRVQVGEGGALEVTVSLRGTPGPGALQIPWAVTGGVNAPGQTCPATGAAVAADFQGGAFPSGTLNLSGQTTATIQVQTLQDAEDESASGPDCFTVALGAQSAWTGAQAGAVEVSGASAAYAEIADALRTLAAAVRSASVDEDAGTAANVPGATVRFTITMRGTENPTEEVRVPWSLRSPDNSLTLGGGAAGLGANSLATRDLSPGAVLSGTVVFPAGADVSGAGNTIEVPVPIAQDALNEGPERLQLSIGDVPRVAGGQSGDIPGTLVSTTTADATVSASDDITVFLAPDPNQGTLTAGESARYTLSFGTTRVNGAVVPIVPTTEVRIPLSVTVGGAPVTLPPAAAAPGPDGNAQIETGNTVVVPSGATQVTVEIPAEEIDAQSQSGTPTLTIAAQTPAADSLPTGAEARPATAQDAAAESQRETERQGRTVVVSAAPPPAQIAGWEITIARPNTDQAPEGAGYQVTFTVEGDTGELSPGGVQIPWAIAASPASTGGLRTRPEDFAPSRSTPPAYDCGQSASAPGACARFPSGRVTIARGAAALTTLAIEIFDDGAEEGQTPEGFTLTLSPLTGPDAAQTTIATGGVQLGALQAEIPALRVDLRIADATAPEGASAEFVLTLSDFSGGARTTRPITVAYMLASGAQPGGALLGEDFTAPATAPGASSCPAQRICALIPAGAQAGAAHRILVPLLLDGRLEPRESFTLTITAATGGGGTVRLRNAAATGTITDDADQSARRRQRVSALVTVLDRQTALLASDAITARLSRPRTQAAQSAQLTLASRNLLARTPRPAEASSPAAPDALGLALYGAAGLGGAAAGLPGAPDATGAPAAPSHTGAPPASAFGGLGAGLAGGANLGSRTALPTLAQLLSGSRFSAATFFDPAHLAAGLEVWGSGGVASLRANPQQSGGALHYDGDSTAFFIGADRPLRQSLLAGLALGWSAGDLDFTDRAGGLELRGNLSTHTLSLHPYIGWQPGPHLRTWLMLGFGSGSVDMEEREASGAAQLSRTLNGSADSSLFMFSTGFAGRRQLSDAADLKLGLSLMRVSSDVDGGRFHDGAELPGVRGRSTRLGGEAELGRSYQFSGLSLRPFGTLRFRLDRSSLISAGEQRGMEKSLDWGAGLQAAWPNLGLDGRFALSRQLNQTGHEEQRISVDLSYDLSGDSRGLTLALQSALRQSHRPLSAVALSAANALSAASAATVASTPGAPAAGQMEQSLSGEIGYGVAFRQFGHSGLLTPYGR